MVALTKDDAVLGFIEIYRQEVQPFSDKHDLVVQQHGGTIAVDSRVDEFTEFAIRLPRAYRPAPAEAAS
jgi:hypothetical protein